jgi:mRNA interferase HicA
MITRLEAAGAVLILNGAERDIFHNPATGATQPVPRHREINELLARKILRNLAGQD